MSINPIFQGAVSLSGWKYSQLLVSVESPGVVFILKTEDKDEVRRLMEKLPLVVGGLIVADLMGFAWVGFLLCLCSEFRLTSLVHWYNKKSLE